MNRRRDCPRCNSGMEQIDRRDVIVDRFQWWDAGGKTELTPEFVQRVEATPSSMTTWVWDAEKGFVSLEASGE